MLIKLHLKVFGLTKHAGFIWNLRYPAEQLSDKVEL